MTKIDWTAPLEAYRSGCDPVSVVMVRGPDEDGDYQVDHNHRGIGVWFHSDGRSEGGFSDWRIRNRSQPQTIPPELVGSIIAFVRDVARGCRTGLMDEARAILAELEPVDKDLLMAREVGEEKGLHGELIVAAILEAIKRVRAEYGEGE